MKERLEQLEVHRMCCRRMMIGYVDLIKDQLMYPNDDLLLEPGVVMKKMFIVEQSVSCD